MASCAAAAGCVAARPTPGAASGYRTDTTRRARTHGRPHGRFGTQYLGPGVLLRLAPHGRSGNDPIFSMVLRFGETQPEKRNLIRYNNVHAAHLETSHLKLGPGSDPEYRNSANVELPAADGAPLLSGSGIGFGQINHPGRHAMRRAMNSRRRLLAWIGAIALGWISSSRWRSQEIFRSLRVHLCCRLPEPRQRVLFLPPIGLRRFDLWLLLWSHRAVRYRQSHERPQPRELHSA